MRPCRAAPMMVLLLLGLAEATTPAPDGAATMSPALTGSIPPGRWVFDYKALVAAAVELLNAKPVSPYVLKLWEVKDQPGQPVDLRERQELSFTVEETTCRAPGTATTSCKSRWLGAVTRCRGWVFLEGQQPTVELSCEKTPTWHPRGRTSKLKDFFNRIKDRFRSLFQCSKIWIRDKLNLPKSQP